MGCITFDIFTFDFTFHNQEDKKSILNFLDKFTIFHTTSTDFLNLLTSHMENQADYKCNSRYFSGFHPTLSHLLFIEYFIDSAYTCRKITLQLRQNMIKTFMVW